MNNMSSLINHASLRIARSDGFSKLVTRLEKTHRPRANLLPVLTYHRVNEPDTPPSLYPGLISATPAEFEQQMSYLAANCHVVSMAELLRVRQFGATLPPRSVMVTFDDACRDFARYAWPILKCHDIPVTLFVPTAFPDQAERVFWWDRLYLALKAEPDRDCLLTPIGRLPLKTAVQRDQAFRNLRNYVKTLPHVEAMAWIEETCDQLGAPPAENAVLSWDELRRLAREGVTLGAHSRTHPLMNRISPEEVRSEAIGSLHDLHREIGSALPIFAYPSGAVDDQVTHVLERERFVLAFTTSTGVNDLSNTDWLRLRRINMSQRANLAVLRARLLPWSAHLS